MKNALKDHYSAIKTKNTIENITLRNTVSADLPYFYDIQREPAGVQMAAFTAKDPNDRNEFNRHWTKILNDKKIVAKTIEYNGQIAGTIISHSWFGDPEVCYWIAQKYWGKGIATQALSEFLKFSLERPLFARTAKDNAASIRILQKNSFKICGEDKGYANARGQVIEEYVFELK